MTKYKLIIFDLDGTLINSVADLAYSTNHALESLSLPTHPQDKYNYFVGNGVNLLLERALPQGYKTKEWVQKLKEVMVPYYNAHCKDRTMPYPGIKPLINKINDDKNIKIAIASNKYQEATNDIVKYFFPNIDFVKVLGQREGEPIKPEPSIVYDILSTAGVSREETLYVGDTCVDMQTARNASVSAVGVSWGFRPRAELEAENPQFVVDDTSQLEKIIFGG